MKEVTITIDRESAMGAQTDISDFLCWISGYNAGCEGLGYPFDTNAVRNLNIKLKTALYRKPNNGE